MQFVTLCVTERRAFPYEFPRRLWELGNLWQSRYWEHTIRNEADLLNHIDYIHFNPVKHGWVESVVDWPYSSFHQFVEQGQLEPNWGLNGVNSSQNFGER